MDLTTESRVLQLVNPGGVVAPESDTAAAKIVAIVRQLITQVSKQAADYMDREPQIKTVTEYFDVPRFRRVFPLRNYPVLSVSSVTFDVDQDWDNVDALDSDAYLSPLYDDAGLLELKSDLVTGNDCFNRSLRVVYRGGMAVDPVDFVTRYPDIAGAVEQQIVHYWHRRNQQGVNISSEAGTVTWNPPQYEFLLIVRDALRRYRRDPLAA